MAYYSRTYLREKWDSLKYEMEEYLDIYKNRTDIDKIDEHDINMCKYNVIDMLDAIKAEISND